MSNPRLKTFHIGLDDTDSALGMCTTFHVYNLVRSLSLRKGNTRLVDYPNLIRLNPNIPWKTRGNGALCIRLETELSKENLFGICKNYLDKFATGDDSGPGLIIHEGGAIPDQVEDFSRRALYAVISVNEARALIKTFEMSSYHLRSGRGLIGALAAIGNELRGDFTFELIAYRKDVSIRREIERSKVIKMSRHTYPRTFNSYDEENNRVLIAPHGPDPVLVGIRGETPSAVREAFELIQPLRNLLGYMIFRSNQGTGEHLRNFLDLGKLRAYTSGRVVGFVDSKPSMQKGGHLFFEIRNLQGALNCACYEPTGRLRDFAMLLVPGDEIEVGGGIRRSTIRHPRVLNVEYIRTFRLAKKFEYENPNCKKCRVSMSSEGKNQGFRCKKCGLLFRGGRKIPRIINRRIRSFRLYLPDLKAHRHLTKPAQRYLLERCSKAGEEESERSWTNVSDEQILD